MSDSEDFKLSGKSTKKSPPPLQLQQNRQPSSSTTKKSPSSSVAFASVEYGRSSGGGGGGVKSRGLCLLFNQEKFLPKTGQAERRGSDVDADSVERTFSRLCFEVLTFRNLTVEEMRRQIATAAARDHKTADCFAIVVLSHGVDGSVYAKDDLVALNDLVRPLKPDVCPGLAGKPKLFFVQSCRGARYDVGTYETIDGGGESDEEEDGPTDQLGVTQNSLTRIPVESDFFFFYSTPPGYFAWRNDREGSWFVQTLCRVLEMSVECDEPVEFTQLMLTVQRMVASEYESKTGDLRTSRMKQMPVTVSTLRKLLYFRPM